MEDAIVDKEREGFSNLGLFIFFGLFIKLERNRGMNHINWKRKRRVEDKDE